mmetsp:Transcript_8617/g.35914  ORF Transcript_8617/g.35914 Transcript_8617/m.35914 type:complete len:361 (-) Transcript_8617:73-1155(-)|eukprot:CAMPEP_0114609774 /NCGR_PEP_ID=MMETSP0168-20121206/3259_1 /TAXON_ID=95228 ORGANISM="Vannella sp., Strain DIVA3 517/6/12" /NCGR_SAMPLE_ID=MMETSP0168 /ASSEMBLY_ACC=CAM_ASM_000044 /LENGTH=360 /DNA_ID=CAMNT_0001820697 /DNA_START=166 /DNA_END=1248 /DNA_ORIENTATION=+
MADIDWELVGSKLGMAAAVLLIGMVCGMAPLTTKNMNVVVRDRLLGVANAFAAGIFLAAGFVHLLAEGIELFSDLYTIDVNLALIIAPVGFLVTFIIDKVLFLRDQPAQIHEHVFPPTSDYGTSSQKVHIDQDEHYHAHGHKHTHDHGHDKDSDDEHELFDGEAKPLNGKHSHDGADHAHGADHGGHGHSHGITIDSSGRPSLTNYILVAVLSFHSILAGFVIGLDQDLSSAVGVFIALISHHWIESFALGVALLRSAVRTLPMTALITFFSLMAPIGIIVGMIVAGIIEDADALEAYCLSFASGTFIYVAIVDILLEEFEIARDKWIKLFAVFFGFACDAAIILTFEHLGHSETEEHGH